MGDPPNYLYGSNDTSHPYPSIQLHPEQQHVPLDGSSHRPPLPLASTSDLLYVYTVSFQDFQRCAYMLQTAFDRARDPDRIRIILVDQPKGEACVDVYCNQGDCPRRNQIIVEQRNATESKGPALARHYVQNLLLQHLDDASSFCLGIDGHSIFTNDWDHYAIKDWHRTENEMGILTTYVHDYNLHANIQANGTNTPYPEVPYLCDVTVGTRDLPRNEGATTVHQPTRPLLQSKWGAGFSFGKCHAEQRVRIPAQLDWVFDGEEHSRAALLWMAGYDFYAPSVTGQVVYHNYTENPTITEWNDNPQTEEDLEIGANRVKLMTDQPFSGRVSTRNLDWHGYPRVRDLQQYLDFTGIHNYENTSQWTHVCHRLHFVPYKRPEFLADLLPDWDFVGETGTQNHGNKSLEAAYVKQQREQMLPALPQQCENFLIGINLSIVVGLCLVRFSYCKGSRRNKY